MVPETGKLRARVWAGATEPLPETLTLTLPLETLAVLTLTAAVLLEP